MLTHQFSWTARSGVSLLAAAALALLSACASNSQPAGAHEEESAQESDSDLSGGVPALAPETEDRGAYPNQDLTENLLYEYLLAEIAAQRGNVGLAAQAYVDLAKRTRDPRIARRATEVALYARMNNAAIEAAQIWQEAEPQSPRARQALVGLLLNAGRYDEALPHLKKILAETDAKPAE